MIENKVRKNRSHRDARLGSQLINREEKLKYLESIVSENCVKIMEEDVASRIKFSWMKRREAVTKALFDEKVPLKLKGKFL